nr:MAG TPA: hypothetical protein [Caudoviricetes sp.]
MITELKDVKESIDMFGELIDLSMRMIPSSGGSEEDVLDIIEEAWVKYYNSSVDDAAISAALVIALELGFAWNGAVDRLGDPMFHKDTLTKRFLQIIWEEQLHED